MKKLLFIALGFGLLFMSCKKDEPLPTETVKEYVKKDPPIKRPYVDTTINVKKY